MSAADPVRVFVYYRVTTAEQAAAVEQGYNTISEQIASAPGLLRNELLRSVSDQSSFAVFSEWESLAAFSAFSSDPSHRDVTSLLRPYTDTGRAGASFAVYEMVACHHGGTSMGRPVRAGGHPAHSG